MEYPAFTTRPQLERQMKAARQLRAEIVARGFARGVEGLSSLVHRMIERFRGAHGPSVPSWLMDGPQQRSSRR